MGKKRGKKKRIQATEKEKGDLLHFFCQGKKNHRKNRNNGNIKGNFIRLFINLSLLLLLQTSL